MKEFISESQTASQLSERVVTLETALRNLVEEIDCLYGIEYSRDTDLHKAEYCWNDALDRARSALIA